MLKVKSVIALSAILILCHQPSCSSFDFIGVTSGVIGLGQFAVEVLNQIDGKGNGEYEKLLDAMNKMKETNNEFFKKLMREIDESETRKDQKTKEDQLNVAFYYAKEKFDEAVRELKDFGNGEIKSFDYLHQSFERFDLESDKDRTKSVGFILLTSDSQTYYAKNFLEITKVNLNACVTRKSHQQLLSEILGRVKLYFTHYFWTRKIFYDLLQYTSGGNSTYTEHKKTLYVNVVHAYYERFVKDFESRMKTASTEFWTCTDDSYEELKLFSTYIASTNFPLRFTSCDAFTDKKTFVYQYLGSTDLYKQTRKCPFNLINCKSVEEFELKFCRKKDKNSNIRYTSILPKYSSKYEEYCEIDKDSEWYHPDSRAVFGKQNACNCICEEGYYYIDTSPIKVDYVRNRVVTGVKLSVRNNTIFMDVQEGKVKAYGLIKKDTIRWLNNTPDYHSVEKISWDEAKQIDLTPIELSHNEVIVGFQFISRSVNAKKRISLVAIVAPYDFPSGRVANSTSNITSVHGEIPHDFGDADTPVKLPNTNMSISDRNAYVEFTVTSLGKNAGQTTIPFIDTHEVVPNPPSPLQGVSLYVRERKGFGGFLAFRVNTYDVAPYLRTENQIDMEEFRRLTVENICNIKTAIHSESKILGLTKDTYKCLGEDIEFTCKVTKSQGGTLYWVKQQENKDDVVLANTTHKLVKDDRISILYDDIRSIYRLQIEDIKEDDFGTYQCKVLEKDKGKGPEKSVALHRCSVPTFTSLPSRYEKVSKGTEMRLTCGAKGFPAPTVTIERVDGKSVAKQNIYGRTNGPYTSYSITVPDIEKGAYYCKANSGTLLDAKYFFNIDFRRY